jgi:hypothetical protein
MHRPEHRQQHGKEARIRNFSNPLCQLNGHQTQRSCGQPVDDEVGYTKEFLVQTSSPEIEQGNQSSHGPPIKLGG